jgi:hypothetical protein
MQPHNVMAGLDPAIRCDDSFAAPTRVFARWRYEWMTGSGAGHDMIS